MNFRNNKQAFVVVGVKAPTVVLLDDRAFSLYQDRCRVADKPYAAIRATFGNDTQSAFPCITECMEMVALEYVGAFQLEVRSMCARVALGLPLFGDDDGGQPAIIDAPIPNKPAPSAARKKRVPIMMGA